jgi:phosphomannomutase / phosphoglucomutase
MISPGIFKAYDVRGVVDKTLTDRSGDCDRRGARFDWPRTQVSANSPSAATAGCPARMLRDALITEASRSTGIDVVDIGMVPTPLLYFATPPLGHRLRRSVTGSHNPPEYNGLKMMVAGETLHGDAIHGAAPRIDRREFARADRPAARPLRDVAEAYLAAHHVATSAGAADEDRDRLRQRRRRRGRAALYRASAAK